MMDSKPISKFACVFLLSSLVSPSECVCCPTRPCSSILFQFAVIFMKCLLPPCKPSVKDTLLGLLIWVPLDICLWRRRWQKQQWHTVQRRDNKNCSIEVIHRSTAKNAHGGQTSQRNFFQNSNCYLPLPWRT